MNKKKLQKRIEEQVKLLCETMNDPVIPKMPIPDVYLKAFSEERK